MRPLVAYESSHSTEGQGSSPDWIPPRPASLTAVKTVCHCMRSGLMAFTCPLSRTTLPEVAWSGVRSQTLQTTPAAIISANSHAQMHTHSHAADLQQTLQGLVFADQGLFSEGESKSDESTQPRACQRLVFPRHGWSTWGDWASLPPRRRMWLCCS